MLRSLVDKFNKCFQFLSRGRVHSATLGNDFVRNLQFGVFADKLRLQFRILFLKSENLRLQCRYFLLCLKLFLAKLRNKLFYFRLGSAKRRIYRIACAHNGGFDGFMDEFDEWKRQRLVMNCGSLQPSPNNKVSRRANNERLSNAKNHETAS